MGTETKADKVRKSVERNYGQALSRRTRNPGAMDAAQSGSCCGGPAVPREMAARLMGYTGDDTSDLPADAVTSSFGCGNPLAFSAVEVGQTVVDLGSGAGIDLLIAAKKVGRSGKVIGIDMTDAMIERARENASDAGFANVDVRKGYIESLPIDGSSVDWVISNCVINLSPDKAKVFGEIARVLRPGGEMLVSDIVVDSLPWWVTRSSRMHSACVAGAIAEEAYLEGLREAGLTDVDVRARHTYGPEEIEGIINSELPWESGALRRAARPVIRRIAKSLDGRLTSVQVYARKAACCG